MSAPRFPRRWLLGLFVDNLPYKILSVLIALALWFIVRDERVETEAIWALDLQVPAELVVGNEALPELTVGVAGTRVALDRLKHQALVHAVKIKSAEPGLVTLRFRPEDLAAPPGVEVVHVSPSTVSLRLETRASRRVAVRPRIVLDEDTGFRVKRAVVAPDLVKVQGPASVVAAVDQLWTEAIPVPKGSTTITQTVALSLPHPQLRLPEGTSVSVTVELEPIAPATAAGSGNPAAAASRAPAATATPRRKNGG